MNRTELIAQMSATVMAGLLANPHVLAHNPQTGWGLVNCSFDSLEKTCVEMASNLLRKAEAPGGDGWEYDLSKAEEGMYYTVAVKHDDGKLEVVRLCFLEKSEWRQVITTSVYSGKVFGQVYAFCEEPFPEPPPLSGEEVEK